MSSLVNDLQKKIYNFDASTTEILKSAYILARKLKSHDFENWIKFELNGYEKGNDVPEYRILSNLTLEAHNPYHGWQYVLDPTGKSHDSFVRTQKVSQSIHELEHLVSSSEGNLQVLLPDEYSKLIGHPAKMRLTIGRSRIISIIETTKNTVLEWVLKLEDDNIIGELESLSFSEDEIKRAKENIYAPSIIAGKIVNSQIQIDTYNSEQEIELNEIEKILDAIASIQVEMSLSNEVNELLNKNIMLVKQELHKGDADSTSKIRKTLKSIRSILRDVGANIVANEVSVPVPEIVKMISSVIN